MWGLCTRCDLEMKSESFMSEIDHAWTGGPR